MRLTANWSKAWLLSGVVAAAMLCVGCGDTFRPIANPITQPSGDPGSLRNAIVVSTSCPSGSAGCTLPGATTHIDVSGDSEVSQHFAGANPIRALLVGGFVFAVNQADDTLSAYVTFGGPGTNVTTVNLQSAPGVPFSCPVFADSHDNKNIYIAMSPAACGAGGTQGVAVVTATTLSESAAILPNGNAAMGVGTDPESLVELNAGNEVYMANKGSNDVTVINTVDNSISVPNIAVGAAPDYVIASPDNSCVYVANSGADSISVIGTAAHAVITTVPLPAGAAPSFMIFDNNSQRVYVAGGNSVSVLAHSNSCIPTVLKTLTAADGIGTSPVAVAPLADGTRFYVANKGSASVSAMDAGSFHLRSIITVAPNPVSIAASDNSTRVYVASNVQLTAPLAAGALSSIAIINTANDTLAQALPPTVSATCFPGATSSCTLQSPDFVLVTP